MFNPLLVADYLVHFVAQFWVIRLTTVYAFTKVLMENEQFCNYVVS